MAIQRQIMLYSGAEGKIGLFAETSNGHFSFFTTSSSYQTVKTNGSQLRVVAVPIVDGYYCPSLDASPSDKAFGYAMVTASSGMSGYIYASTADPTDSYRGMVIKDEHGTHYGTPSGTNLSQYPGSFVGVMHATTDPGWTFVGWRVSVNGDSSYLQIKDPTSSSPTAHLVFSAGGTVTESSTSKTVIEFKDGYADAVLVQLYESTTRSLTIEAIYESSTPVTTYSISYDPNGGSPTPPSSSGHVAGEEITLPAAISRSGYNFAGWKIGSNTYAASGKYTFGSASVTAVAQWSQVIVRTVQYAKGADDVSGPALPADVVENSTYITLPIPTDWSRFGYAFDGWTTPSGTKHNAGASVLITSDITFTAAWEVSRVYGAQYDYTKYYFDSEKKWSRTYSDYRITLSAVLSGSSMTQGPTANVQYQNCNNIYDSSLVQMTASVQLGSSTTLMVMYSYKVSSDGTIFYSSFCPDSAKWKAPEIPGCEFVGWYTVNNSAVWPDSDPSTSSNYGTLVTSAAETTWGTLRERLNYYKYDGQSTEDVRSGRFRNYLRLVYKGKTITVSFNANKGSGAPSPIRATYETPVTIPSTVPARSRYIFKGWSRTKDASTPEFLPGEQYDFPAELFDSGTSIILWAVWEYGGVTVAFNPGSGGTVSPRYIVALVGQPYGTLPVPQRSGYSNPKWYTAETGGSEVTASTVVSNPNDHILYARWSGSGPTVQHTLTFMVDGVLHSSRLVTGGSTFGTLPSPTKSGYDFVGWFRSTVGSDQVYSSTVMGDDDVTVYAHWQSREITVTFNPNGGTVDEPSRRVSYGSQLHTPPKPYWEGHTFLGWFTDATGGTEVTASTVITSSSVVYAHWDNKSVDWWDVETW